LTFTLGLSATFKTSLVLAENADGLNCPEYYDSPHSQFIDLLRGLWNSYLDVASWNGRDVGLYHAVKAMVKFLIDVSTPNSGYPVAIEYPEDLILVHRISLMFSSGFPDLARELQACLLQLPLWHPLKESPELPGRLSYAEGPLPIKAPPRLKEDVCEGGVVPLINCVSWHFPSANRYADDDLLPVPVRGRAVFTRFIRRLCYG
jgi:hypothetical protein